MLSATNSATGAWSKESADTSGLPTAWFTVEFKTRFQDGLRVDDRQIDARPRAPVAERFKALIVVPGQPVRLRFIMKDATLSFVAVFLRRLTHEEDDSCHAVVFLVAGFYES